MGQKFAVLKSEGKGQSFWGESRVHCLGSGLLEASVIWHVSRQKHIAQKMGQTGRIVSPWEEKKKIKTPKNGLKVPIKKNKPKH